MKRNENKSNRNRSLVVLLVLCAMLAVTLVGCKKPAAENPAPSTSEVVSEEVSEPVSEPVSEEPSEEVVSEEVSEEIEIVDGVQTLYCENYEELCVCFEKLEEPVIAVFHFDYPEEGQSLLHDGAHYTLSENFIVTVKTPEIISSMESSAEYVAIFDYDYNGSHEWDIHVETTGSDIEVPLTITYEDGTTDTITVYITKDWKYSWEG